MLEHALSEAQASIGLFSSLFGPLPYGRIAMTQQPFPSFGQAWPMLVYMPLSAFLDRTYRHQLGMDGWRSETFYRYVTAHEISHQWWGHVVGWKSYRDQWLSEGMAHFSSSLFAQMFYNNEALIKFFAEQRQIMTEKNVEGKRPIDVGAVIMGYRLDTARTGHVAQGIIYSKGAFILHMLRMMMWERQAGDTRFSTMLQDFVKTHFNSEASTEDFKHIVEKHITPAMDLDGNGKMDWFFNQWVYGTSQPEYHLEYRMEPGENGQTKVLAKITQSGVDDSFKMLIPIYADYSGKTIKLGTIAIRGSSTTQELPILLPKKPDSIKLNAFEDVLCTLR
jgi:aminopeptidase N